MKSKTTAVIRRMVILVILTLLFHSASAQINQSVATVNFDSFNITSGHKLINGNYILYINISKGNQLIVTDTALTDTASCQGFSFPARQPFKDYFIFSKHAKHAGKTYILSKTGDYTIIGGGTFWAAPKNKLLFILAEKDYINLVVFSLGQMKTVFEKYSCDEFTGWYYLHSKYFGNVAAECGDELKTEKEVSEWMHPVEIEQFDVKRNTLDEMHLSAEQVGHAKALVKYAGCK